MILAQTSWTVMKTALILEQYFSYALLNFIDLFEHLINF